MERFLQCKARFLASGPLRDAECVLLWGAGKTGRRLSKHLLRQGVPLQSFIDVDRRKIGRTLRGLPILSAEDLGEALRRRPKAVVIAAVPSRGARSLIRRRLQEMGLEEGSSFWCAA